MTRGGEGDMSIREKHGKQRAKKLQYMLQRTKYFILERRMGQGQKVIRSYCKIYDFNYFQGTSGPECNKNDTRKGDF
jgi:hypothetical protein